MSSAAGVAQTATALVAAVGTVFLGGTRIMAPATVEFVAAAISILFEASSTGDQRWWLGIGAVVGVGTMGKVTMVGWVAAMVIGPVAVGGR